MKRAGLLFFAALACLGQNGSTKLQEQELRKRLEALKISRPQLPTARNAGSCSIPLLEAKRPAMDYKLKIVPQTQEEKSAPVPAPPCNELQAGR